MAHTPLPWEIIPRIDPRVATAIAIGSADRKTNICVLTDRYKGQDSSKCRSSVPEADANAEFIVRACNSHDDLLAALEAAKVKLEEVYEADSGEVSIMPDVLSTLRLVGAAIVQATVKES